MALEVMVVVLELMEVCLCVCVACSVYCILITGTCPLNQVASQASGQPGKTGRRTGVSKIPSCSCCYCYSYYVSSWHWLIPSLPSPSLSPSPSTQFLALFHRSTVITRMKNDVKKIISLVLLFSPVVQKVLRHGFVIVLCSLDGPEFLCFFG